jgi:hypothetical protein
MSYGYNAPLGAIPRQYLNGNTWSGQYSPYSIQSGYATALYTGDPVTVSGGYLVLATAGTNAIIGFFGGCRYMDTSGTFWQSPSWPAGQATLGSLNGEGFVVDDPSVLFDMQIASGAGGTVAAPSIAQSNLLQNVNLNVAQGTAYNAVGGVVPPVNPAAGAPLNGQSSWYLDSNTPIGNGAPLQMKIIRFTPVSGNIAGLAFNNALCLVNNHVFKGGTGTAGI